MSRRVAHTAPVSARALLQRINRALPEFRKLKKSRGPSLRDDVGEFFILDEHDNTIRETHIDLEQFGRKLSVLADWEHLDGVEEFRRANRKSRNPKFQNARTLR